MKKRLFTAFAISLTLPFILLSQSTVKFSPRLQGEVNQKMGTGDYLYVSMELTDKFDVLALDQDLYDRKANLNQRAFEVITSLKAHAQKTQIALLDFLTQDPQVMEGSIEPFWVANVIYAKMTTACALSVSARTDVAAMDLSGFVLPDFVESVPLPDALRVSVPNGREPGLTAIRAQNLWAMGFTGQGRIVMGIDSGVEPNHPSLSSKYMGNFAPTSQSWYVYNSPGTTPADCDNSSYHGTHTMGTMCGLNASTNDTIGVAFNARWIGSPGICSGMGTTAIIGAFQWAMDPDGNPATISDMPDAVNNSWYDPNVTGECTSIYQSTFNSLEAAGVAVVFSAGNDGSGASTITAPKNINTGLVNVFCVGNINAANASYPINSSSSRGPGTCGGTGSLLIKPEVVAPGTNVRSASGTNSYASLSGTSMSSPHAAGAVALLKEAFPSLTGIQIKEALYYSATDLGTAGEDNTYGKGIINLGSAYNWLIAQGHTPGVFAWDAQPQQISNITSTVCGTSVQPTVNLRNFGDSVITNLTIWYRYNALPADSVNWSGTLNPSGSVNYNLPATSLAAGAYTLTIITKRPNGNADDRPFNDALTFNFQVEELPIAVGDTVMCGPASLNLTGSSSTSGTLNWYAASIGGISIGSGTSFNTPAISVSTNYFLDVSNTGQVGPANNTIGTGGNFTGTTSYLVFDCTREFVLRSVLVYASTAGNRTIEWRSSSNNVINSVTTNIPAGTSRVNLDFEISPGTGYRLATSGNPNLYRNSAGPIFPYQIPGVVSITGSSAVGYYYFFYDWEVEYGSACGRTQVAAVVSSGISSTITASPVVLDLSISNSAQFYGYAPGATTWAWDFGDGGTSPLQNPTHIFTTPATYTVTLIAGNGTCIDTISTQYLVTQPVGIQPMAENSMFIVYPNPGRDIFQISFGSGLKTNQMLEITNSLGQIVKTEKLKKGILQAEVDLKSAPAGVYYFRINSEGKETSLRVVKE